ncbi:MAG TPA: cysteine-rich CWC family protein, partial [Puia sp.]
MMNGGKQKICPRCKKEFNCHAENISACACSKVTLSNGTKSFLANTFYDCLCTDCLEKLNQLVALEKQYPFPGGGGDLIEGIHYYNE